MISTIVGKLGGKVGAMGWGAALLAVLALAGSVWLLKVSWKENATTAQELKEAVRVAKQNDARAKELKREITRIESLQKEAARRARERREKAEQLRDKLQEELQHEECADTRLPGGAIERLRSIYGDSTGNGDN